MELKTVLIVCLCVGLNYGMRLKKTMMPFELRRAMANVTSLDSFLQAMSIDKSFMSSVREAVRSLNKGEKRPEICRAVSRPKECPPQQKDLCTNDSTCLPGLKCCNTGCRKECSHAVSGLARQISNSDFPDLPHVMLDSAPCEARPAAIEVPQPMNHEAFYFPFFVTLHRCGGACNGRPFDTKCQVEESQDLNLIVNKVAWSSASDTLNELSREITAVRVTNHTKCSCLCATKQEDCNNRTERYNKEECRCDCKRSGVFCPFNFKWNPEKCQCTCSPKPNVGCNKRYQFDKELCRCACSSKRCKIAAKERDPKDCRCKCPPKACSPGMTYDQRTCTCTGNRRKRSM